MSLYEIEGSSNASSLIPSSLAPIPKIYPYLRYFEDFSLPQPVLEPEQKINRITSLQHKCGGAIISNRFVITAASCNVNDSKSIADSVRVGELKFGESPDCVLDEITDETECNPKEVDIRIHRWFMHPEYKKSSKHNDIALIRLRKRMNFDNLLAAAICLPLESHLLSGSLSNETIFDIVGWGTIISYFLFFITIFMQMIHH